MQRRTITIKQFKLKTMDKIKLELDKNQERLANTDFKLKQVKRLIRKVTNLTCLTLNVC